MRRTTLALLLASFAIAAYVASSWPDLLYRYDRWQRARADEDAAPAVSRLTIYSSLSRRLFKAVRNPDPYEVSLAANAAPRVLRTSFEPSLTALLLLFSRERDQHLAHIVLGRTALLANDLESAECHLLASVAPVLRPRYRTPFYPPLPDMTLAQELLVRGRRAAVLRYLTECEPVWPPNEAHRLPTWRQRIERGITPDFERWSAYPGRA